MKPHRLRAPAADGALLAEPALSEAGGRLAENVGRLARWEHDFQGRRAGPLRALARQQLLAQARAYLARFGLELPVAADAMAPLFVAGHQPELYHAGVWVKNFAVAGLARAHQGAGLNLIVDNDIPKSESLRVPERAPHGLRTQAVEFDDGAGDIPYEDLKVRDETRFATFAERVRIVLDDLVPDSLIADYWPRVLRFGVQTPLRGLRFALARRDLEAEWGIRNWEVPLSTVCETESFLWFASHLLAHLPRFQEVHNAALGRYRLSHGIRSTHHPVPALGRDGDWLEAPFWAWRAERPRRHPLLIRQHHRSMELRIAGDDAPFLEIPLSPEREACCAVERLLTLPAHNIRLRTRALTTTLFSRLILSDVFMHGIGGAKYDELGDEIVREFYGIEPPSYLTLSMTLWLGVEDDPATQEEFHAVDRELRDLTFNPDRQFVEEVAPELREWVEAKWRAIGAPAQSHRQRVARFHEIRHCNEAMQSAVQAARDRLTAQRERLLEGLRRNAVARNREYAFVLHSPCRLRQAMSPVVPSAIDG